jgi:hypothetical protein
MHALGYGGVSLHAAPMVRRVRASATHRSATLDVVNAQLK